MKTALITGATSGIGKATAIALAKGGYQLVICGRRAERLQQLKEELSELVPVLTRQFDVRDKELVFEQLSHFPEPFHQIDVLINNAGIAHGLDPIQTGSVEDWDAMIDINVKGLLYVSKPIIANMIANKGGHIINIGSIAGKEVYLNGNVYNASKHSVDALSQAMRMDLNSYGIKVGQISPGLVQTEFSEVRFKGDKQRADKVYEGYKALQAEDVADLIHFMVTRPAHVNLADILILPNAQASATILKKESD